MSVDVRLEEKYPEAYGILKNVLAASLEMSTFC
jgi:hypothetical protein